MWYNKVMKELDPTWSYRQLRDNLPRIKRLYEVYTARIEDRHKRVLFKQQVKKQIYSYPYAEKTRDRIWYILIRQGGDL